MQQNDQRDRPIGELLRDLSIETATLVRQEVALARVEIEAKVRSAGRSIPMFAGAAAFGVGAFGALTAALIAGLALVVDVWLAAVIVAVVYGIVAFILIERGRAHLRKAAPLVPQTTAQTVKEDIAWAKTRVNSKTK